jgi:hypothetical protein
MTLTEAEAQYCREIAAKDAELRKLFSADALCDPPDPRSWYTYLSTIKQIQGNLNNSLSFIATLMAKQFLAARLPLRTFDAAAKAVGAAGHDIEAWTVSGERVVGEVKTVFFYLVRDFGAAQKREFDKDVAKLQSAEAGRKFLFVTEAPTYAILIGRKYAAKIHGITVVNLMSGEEHHAA